MYINTYYNTYMYIYIYIKNLRSTYVLLDKVLKNIHLIHILALENLQYYVLYSTVFLLQCTQMFVCLWKQRGTRLKTYLSQD